MSDASDNFAKKMRYAMTMVQGFQHVHGFLRNLPNVELRTVGWANGTADGETGMDSPNDGSVKTETVMFVVALIWRISVNVIHTAVNLAGPSLRIPVWVDVEETWGDTGATRQVAFCRVVGSQNIMESQPFTIQPVGGAAPVARYKLGKDVFIAPYDWRLAGDAHSKRQNGVGGYYSQLQLLIEEAVQAGAEGSTARKPSCGFVGSSCLFVVPFLLPHEKLHDPFNTFKPL